MRTLLGLMVAVLLVQAIAAPSFARVATIQTSASPANHSDASVKAAVNEAIYTAVRGAVPMGFPTLQMNQVLLLDDAVVVEILAVETDVEDGELDGFGPQAGADTEPQMGETR